MTPDEFGRVFWMVGAGLFLLIAVAFALQNYSLKREVANLTQKLDMINANRDISKATYYRTLPERIKMYEKHVLEVKDQAERKPWLTHIESLKIEYLKYLAREDEDILGKIAVRN